MARNIFTVNATQVVVSDANPQGVFSIMPNYPKNYDSLSYNGDAEAALRAAKSEYYSRLSQNYVGSATRVMSTVTLSQANGQIVIRDSIGSFPVIAPSEPEPETPTGGEEEPTEGEGE